MHMFLWIVWFFFGPHRETSAFLPPNLILDKKSRKKRFSVILSFSLSLCVSLPTQEWSADDTPHSDTHNFSIIKICCSPWLCNTYGFTLGIHSFSVFPCLSFPTIRFFVFTAGICLLPPAHVLAQLVHLFRAATGDLTALFLCVCVCVCVAISSTCKRKQPTYVG